MQAIARLVVLYALICTSAGAAQLYRWVDETGRVEWRDTPPPAHAKEVEKRNVGGNSIQTSTLPYSARQAAKNFPVTLWVFDCGAPCTQARAHLAKRGVSYAERDAQRDLEELKKAFGGPEVPVLVVGSSHLKGYLEADWDAALDRAGYPRALPAGVKAPVRKPEPSKVPAATTVPPR